MLFNFLNVLSSLDSSIKYQIKYSGLHEYTRYYTDRALTNCSVDNALIFPINTELILFYSQYSNKLNEPPKVESLKSLYENKSGSGPSIGIIVKVDDSFKLLTIIYDYDDRGNIRCYKGSELSDVGLKTQIVDSNNIALFSDNMIGTGGVIWSFGGGEQDLYWFNIAAYV